MSKECSPTGLICKLFENKAAHKLNHPNYRKVKEFDLETKHFLYGRIDNQSNAVYVDDSPVLQEIEAGKESTKWAVNFVCDAFDDFSRSFKKIIKNNLITSDSLYATEMKAYRAYNNGDLAYRYNKYLDGMYFDFVNTYLQIDRRHEKIKNFHDFIREFIGYILRFAREFPFTKTGYILSVHSSPYISGLMLDIAPENYGLQYNLNVRARIDDPYYPFFVKHASRFGFMVDKNAPWRLVFNVNSGQFNKAKDGSIVAGQKYMDRYAVDHSNVFRIFYKKAHLEEMDNIKNQLYSFYEQYVLENDSYEELKHRGSPSGNCSKMTVKHTRRMRETAAAVSQTFKQAKTEWDEYWIKILLKLRMKETGYPHTTENFRFFSDKAIQQYRLFGKKPALNYINNLTKGLYVTKFNREGQYWYGTAKEKYENRKRDAIQNALDPARVQYPITGTKNKVK